MTVKANRPRFDLGKLEGRENIYFLAGGRRGRVRTRPQRTLPYYLDAAHFDEIIRLSDVRDGQCVVDLFAGNPIPGATALSLKAAAPNADVIGIDPSATLSEAAKDNAAIVGIEGIDFRVADDRELPFASNTVDVVTERLGFHWTREPSAAVREIHRVLTANGRLVFIEVIAPPDTEAQRWILETYEHAYFRRDQIERLFRQFAKGEEVSWPITMSVDTMAWESDAHRAKFISDFEGAPQRYREIFNITGHGSALQFQLDMVMAVFVKPASARRNDRRDNE